jgi:hypothetical protein
MIIDLEKLPLVQFWIQEGHMESFAPDLLTFLILEALPKLEDFWEWLVARHLVRKEDR